MQAKRLLSLIIPPAILTLLTTIFYWPALRYPFQFDDNLAILKQFGIRNSNISTAFFSGTRWVGDWINAFNFQLNRFDPFIFRTTNLAIHISASILVFYAIYWMLSLRKDKNFFTNNSFVTSLTTALLFALHPVQTQTVSYIIQGRLEGLSALFILAAIVCFLAFTQIKQTALAYLWTVPLFAFVILACGSKEIAIITPLLILLVDWFFVAQGTWPSLKKRLPLHGGIFVLTLSIFWYFKKALILKTATLQAQVHSNVGNILTNSIYETIKPIPFLLSQFKVILHYIWIFIWPFNLSVEYDEQLVSSFWAPNCLVPFMILVGITTILVLLLRKNKKNIFGFALLWFAICIAPRSTIVPSAELVADYKTYLASIGIFLLLAAGIVKLCLALIKKLKVPKSKTNYFLLTLVGIFTLTLGLATYQRNKVWGSALTFWEDIIKKAPQKARAYNNYGIALIKDRQYRKAVTYLKQALRLQRENYWDPYTNLSIAYDYLDQTDRALQAIKRAISINQAHPESYNSLGLLFMKKKNWDNAEKSFQAALIFRPHYGKAYYNLGLAYYAQNKIEKAWECFRDCCTKGDLDTVINGFADYATTSMKLKKYDHAITAYKKILQLHPDHQDSWLNLANAYLFNDNIDKAIATYEQMAKQYPDDFRPLANAGQVYLTMKQPKKALPFLQRARKIDGAPLEIDLKIARCLHALGQKDLAHQMLQKLSKQDQEPATKTKALALLASW